MIHRFRPVSPVACLAPILAAAVAAAQAPEPPAAAPAPAAAATAQAPDDLAALTRRIEAAHRPHGPVPPVTSFRCNLQLEVLDRNAEHRAPVDLSVEFMLWRRDDGAKQRPLIRYEIPGAEPPIVRGRDVLGPWQMFQGEPRDLTGSEFAQDLEQCTQHTNLARQLLRFLSPAEVLQALERPSGVSTAELRIDRRPVECTTVSGDLPAFPLLQNAGEDAPVRLQVFVDPRTDRLIGVDVWPLVAGEPDAARGERILLYELGERNDLLVPLRLDYYFRDPDGKLRLNSRARMPLLDLRPNLLPADFDRRR